MRSLIFIVIGFGFNSVAWANASESGLAPQVYQRDVKTRSELPAERRKKATEYYLRLLHAGQENGSLELPSVSPSKENTSNAAE